jgi:hypothetical protein
VDSVLNEAVQSGSYFISAANVLGSHPAAELVAKFYPSAKLKVGHGKFASLVDFSKASSALKFRPQHNFPNE